MGVGEKHTQAYIIILRTHIDEKLAIAQIIRSRVRRQLATATLERHRRTARAKRGWEAMRVELERMMRNAGIRRRP